ncbi:MAG TPA: twin-arginine translocase TatA/TatE family subunit [Candidatus Dormibacteraeota bacterium]|jgi:sec-independent protein translocase protein TatA
MFGHSWLLFLLILVIVLIIFGPGKLSQLGGAMGRSIREFRKTKDEPNPPGGGTNSDTRP